MVSASTADSRLGDFTASIPDPGSSAREHLAHTVACLSRVSDGHVVARGDGTALTVADLRALNLDPANRDALMRLLTVLVANRGVDGASFVVTATSGVYGAGSTGLTWSDLLELAL